MALPISQRQQLLLVTGLLTASSEGEWRRVTSLLSSTFTQHQVDFFKIMPNLWLKTQVCKWLLEGCMSSVRRESQNINWISTNKNVSQEKGPVNAHIFIFYLHFCTSKVGLVGKLHFQNSLKSLWANGREVQGDNARQMGITGVKWTRWQDVTVLCKDSE